MRTETFELETAGRRVVDISREVRAFARTEGDGLVHVFLPHATAGLAILETGAGSEPDLEAAIERLLPRTDTYRHRHGSTGHGADHVLPAFIAPSLSVPVVEGEVLLGTWQSICVVDTNDDNPRRTVRMSFLAG